MTTGVAVKFSFFIISYPEVIANVSFPAIKYASYYPAFSPGLVAIVTERLLGLVGHAIALMSKNTPAESASRQRASQSGEGPYTMPLESSVAVRRNSAR